MPKIARRNHHADATGIVTGDLPVAYLLTGVPSQGGIDTGRADMEDALTRDAWKFGWAGCLDVVDLVLVGGIRAVFIEGTYEGTAPRSVVRG